MKTYVLDASALLRYTDNEAGANTVEHLIDLAQQHTVELYMSSVNWGEVVYVVMRSQGPRATAILDSMKQSLPIQLHVAGDTDAEQAASLKVRWNLPYTDAFAAALAARLAATLLTADYDFKSVASGLRTEFLPRKP